MPRLVRRRDSPSASESARLPVALDRRIRRPATQDLHRTAPSAARPPAAATTILPGSAGSAPHPAAPDRPRLADRPTAWRSETSTWLQCSGSAAHRNYVTTVNGSQTSAFAQASIWKAATPLIPGQPLPGPRRVPIVAPNAGHDDRTGNQHLSARPARNRGARSRSRGGAQLQSHSPAAAGRSSVGSWSRTRIPTIRRWPARSARATGARLIGLPPARDGRQDTDLHARRDTRGRASARARRHRVDVPFTRPDTPPIACATCCGTSGCCSPAITCSKGSRR